MKLLHSINPNKIIVIFPKPLQYNFQSGIKILKHMITAMFFCIIKAQTCKTPLYCHNFTSAMESSYNDISQPIDLCEQMGWL